MVDEDDRYTSAMLINSTTWDRSGDWPQPRNLRVRLAREAMAWQNMSRHGAVAEEHAYPIPMHRNYRSNGKIRTIRASSGKPPREPNRILELHGIMGAVGEQVGLARTFELDVQRLIGTAKHRDEVEQRIVQRAMCEAGAYFTLGAIHSLANVAVRLLLLNDSAAKIMEVKFPNAGGFRPGSDEREAWITLHPTSSRAMGKAARDSGNPFMLRAVDAVRKLQRGQAFRELDDRRGMDYHRRRPQSVAHSSPRKNVVEVDPSKGWMTLTMPAPSLEPEANADRVHSILVNATEHLRIAMRDVRRAVPMAIRAEAMNYVVG